MGKLILHPAELTAQLAELQATVDQLRARAVAQELALSWLLGRDPIEAQRFLSLQAILLEENGEAHRPVVAALDELRALVAWLAAPQKTQE